MQDNLPELNLAVAFAIYISRAVMSTCTPIRAFSRRVFFVHLAQFLNYVTLRLFATKFSSGAKNDALIGVQVNPERSDGAVVA